MDQNKAKKIVKISGYLTALGMAIGLWFQGDRANALGVLAAAITGVQVSKDGV